jgi:signal transduction histidine kinase
MIQHSPLRLRIALLSTALSGLVMVMFGAGAWWVVAQQKTATLDARIRALGSRQPGWLFQDRDFRRLEENLDFVLTTPGDTTPFFLLVADAGGRLLHQSASWPAGLDPADFSGPLPGRPGATEPPDGDPLMADDGGRQGGRGWGGPGRGRGPGGSQAVRFTKGPQFITVTGAGQSWRVGRLGNDDMTVVIGLSAEAHAGEMRQLRNAAAVALPVALLLIGLGGWVVAGRALRPLHQIAATASRVTLRGLDQRIPAIGGDPEITRLVNMLNGMMDRLEAGFLQTARFSADASHELKTPLAIMRGELEQAVQRAAPGSQEQQTLTSLLEETHRLGAIIRSLLLLSRADAGQLLANRETVDLTALVADLAEDTAVSAEDTGIRVTPSIDSGIRVSGDEQLLRTAFHNLFANALRHNRSGGTIAVRLTAADGCATFEIANTGAPISPDERNEIFKRFRRGRDSLDHARDGVGLGLSLAHEIIAAHGGTLTLAEDRGDGLNRFVAVLPEGGSRA